MLRMPRSRTTPPPPITRSELERALDELISNKRGIDFQRIAVPLARERCPSLVANEISKDGGEDAFLVGKLPDGTVLSVAASLTATLDKIRNDIRKIKTRKPQVNSLWFYTPRAPTTEKIDPWKEAIRRDFDVKLEVITREEVVGRLLDPRFDYLAYHHLGLPHPLFNEVREARALLARDVPDRLGRWLSMRIDGRVRPVERDYVVDDGECPSTQRISAAEVAGTFIDGGLFALWGEGGIGKSIALEQLAHTHSEGPTRPVPLLISAPAWARSGQELPAFLGAQFLGEPEHYRTSITNLLRAGELGIFINGWNEVAPEARAALAERLTNILNAAPGCPILLATRTVADLGGLAPLACFRVLPLSPEARADLVRQLAPEALAALEEFADADKGVELLSRSPLFLIPMAEALARGESLPRTRAALLEAALRAMERSPDHASAWIDPSVKALLRPVLGRIAFELSSRGSTEGSRAEVEGWIAGQIPGAAMQPVILLDQLIQHHVLERDGTELIRFQHEYFQDWLCAQHIRPQGARKCTPETTLAEWLDNRRLGTAWALLIEALAGEPNETEARVVVERLFRVALDVDLQLAAEWLPVFRERLSRSLTKELTDRLSQQITQGGSARRLALSAVFAARLPEFADQIWEQLESPDQHERQELDNLREQIPIEVLGANWRTRLMQWPPERRAEFVTHQATVADSPDPLVLQRGLATRDPSALVQAHCIQDIAFEDRAAGDALFTAASDECQGVLLELGAWNMFSREAIAPLIPLLENLARYPVTTPRCAQALAYLADRYPDKALATYRKQFERALPGAPEYDRSLQFLAEHDRAWTAEWVLRQLVDGKRVPMNGAELLRGLPSPKRLAPVLESVLSAPTDAEHSRGRALAVLIEVGGQVAVERCLREWTRAHAEFYAGAPQRDPQLGTRLAEVEGALANASVDLLVAALWEHNEEFQSAEAIASIARIVANDPEDHGDDDSGSGSAEALRTLIKQLVQRALTMADPKGKANSALVRLIERCGDSALRTQLEKLLAAERFRRLTTAGVGVRTPIAIRIFAGQQYMAAVRKLAGSDAIEALLPMLDADPFDLAAAAQLVEELDARAGRPKSFNSTQIDWPAVAKLQRAVSPEPLSEEAQKIVAALDRRIVRMRQGAGGLPEVEARATLEVLRAQIVGYVRGDPLVAVPVTPQSIYTLVDWAAAFLRRGVVAPAAWLEQMLAWLTSASEASRLGEDDRARLVNGCLIALMFSDSPGLAAHHIRRLRTDGRSPWLFADLLVPIAVSGIPEQVSLLLELMPNSARDSYWWAWREALKYSAPAVRQQLIAALLAGGVPAPLLEVIISHREPDLSATIAASIEASSSLRRAVESLVASADPSSREFALTVIENIGDLRAAESLLALAISEPNLRPRVGRILVGTRWPRPEGERWSTISAPHAVTSIRKRLLSLTVDTDESLHQWAASVLADIDASVEGAFPMDEPRHPDLPSGIPWPVARATDFPRAQRPASS
jgi:hypothetical protein